MLGAKKLVPVTVTRTGKILSCGNWLGTMLWTVGLRLLTKYVKIGPTAFGQLSEVPFTRTGEEISAHVPVKKACGVTAMICSDDTEIGCHAVPPPPTVAGSSKLWPVMMTCVPPKYEPKPGAIEVIVGQL